MKGTLQGAYVQAWVWVHFTKPLRREAIVALAREEWQKDGEVEVDDNAKVSRSYE